MINSLFLFSVGTIGGCAIIFWLHPKYDDCLWGRLGLLTTMGGSLMIGASVLSGYRYEEVLPEVALIFAGQASYMAWLVWRFIRKRIRIARGIDKELHPN